MAELVSSIAINQLLKLIINFIKKKKKNKTELQNEELDFILINLSGFPLSNQAKNEVLGWGTCKIIEKEVPTLDLGNPSKYMDNIINFCADAIKELIEKDYILPNLLLGKYIFIPPGMTSIAMVFITMLHGISGHFPKMTFNYKTDIGYSLIKPFDFQNLRLKYRNILKISEKIENKSHEIPLLNYSGFTLSSEAQFEVKKWNHFKISNREIPTIDLNDPFSYMENVTNFWTNTFEELKNNEWILSNLNKGTYIVIPPGMTSIAITLIVILHGISGHFPKASFFYKKDMVYSLIKPFDFQDLRTRFRDIKQFE